MAILTWRGLPCAKLFDLDRHRIPARGQEPEHWHYDVRFVVRACTGEDFRVSAESLALAWGSIDELAVDKSLEPSIRRMATRWLGRAGQASIEPAV